MAERTGYYRKLHYWAKADTKVWNKSDLVKGVVGILVMLIVHTYYAQWFSRAKVEETTILLLLVPIVMAPFSYIRRFLSAPKALHDEVQQAMQRIRDQSVQVEAQYQAEIQRLQSELAQLQKGKEYHPDELERIRQCEGLLKDKTDAQLAAVRKLVEAGGTGLRYDGLGRWIDDLIGPIESCGYLHLGAQAGRRVNQRFDSALREALRRRVH